MKAVVIFVDAEVSFELIHRTPTRYMEMEAVLIVTLYDKEKRHWTGLDLKYLPGYN
jgi:hypothetical protein